MPSTGPFVEGKKNGSQLDNGAVYDVEYDHDRELSEEEGWLMSSKRRERQKEATLGWVDLRIRRLTYAAIWTMGKFSFTQSQSQSLLARFEGH